MRTEQQRNPLQKLDVVDGVAGRDGVPVPLVGEHMRIVIRGSLATVSREQVFRNGEKSSIEATITFPVPVHATLHHLTARIAEQTLTATAMARSKARETYETAVDEGKTAVLHEELLRGIHMLSIAHIPPGAEVAVTHEWIAALSPRDAGKWLLRIPITLGDVYGDSPFNDADDLRVSPRILHEADVQIDAGTATAVIANHVLSEGQAKIRLDAPIDVEITGAAEQAVRGRSADGRAVEVSVIDDAVGEANIDAVILVDRSASMGSAALAVAPAARRRVSSKHDAVLTGLAAAELRAGDLTELWQFDNMAERVSGPEERLARAIRRLGAPRGGTEIGGALRAVVASSPASDILLITDGLSHALDVQSLVNSGRRFTVVLVGEDSLEANVGRLAALTGGQIILATGAGDAAEAVSRAIASLRRSRERLEPGRWPLDRAVIHTGGAVVKARWGVEAGLAVEPAFASAVGALAAALALARLGEAEATAVAAEHGLVCHLTSLVLVDEAGAVQESLPAQRKIPLMEQRLAARAGLMAMPVAAPALPSGGVSHEDRRRMLRDMVPRPGAAAPRRPSLRQLAKGIDWGADPEALRRGDLSGLRPETAAAIREAAETSEVVILAGPAGNAVVIVIALLARSLGWSSRGARRIAKAVLDGLDQAAIGRAMTALGL